MTSSSDGLNKVVMTSKTFRVKILKTMDSSKNKFYNIIKISDYKNKRI